jgi:hypothetical protein
MSCGFRRPTSRLYTAFYSIFLYSHQRVVRSFVMESCRRILLANRAPPVAAKLIEMTKWSHAQIDHRRGLWTNAASYTESTRPIAPNKRITIPGRAEFSWYIPYPITNRRASPTKRPPYLLTRCGISMILSGVFYGVLYSPLFFIFRTEHPTLNSKKIRNEFKVCAIS